MIDAKALIPILILVLAVGPACEKISHWMGGGEHPAEHPEEGEGEHPEKNAKEPGARAELSREEMVQEYTMALKGYLEENKGSALSIQDVNGHPTPIAGELELVKIHDDKIIRYEGDTHFACSDFRVASADGGTDYDLDFFMERSPTGWTMKRILLHKINGKLQLTYKDNEPVPVN